MSQATIQNANGTGIEQLALDHFLFGNLDRAAATSLPANARLQSHVVRQLTQMQTHGSHLLGASAVFPRARVAHERTELGHGDAPATAALAASAA